MITNKEKHDMDWRAIEDISITTYETMDSEVSKPIILGNSCTLEPPQVWRLLYKHMSPCI